MTAPVFRAFSHGVDAMGARYVREGFAATKEDDLAFALGYPHAVGLVDAHPDESEADPEVRADAIVAKYYASSMPTSFAHKRARALAVWKVELGKKRAAVVEEAIAKDDPLTEADARAMIRHQVTSTTWMQGGIQEQLLHLLEALFGPDAILDEVLSSLESVDAPALRDAVHVRGAVTRYLGYGLLRVPKAAHDASVARAKALLEKAQSAGPIPNHSAAHWIDLALHGADAAARVQPPQSMFVVHVLDRPELVQKVVTSEPIQPTFRPLARLAFLGGDPVVEHYRQNLKKVKDATLLPRVAHEFATMRSEEAQALVRELATTSKPSRRRR